MNNNNYIDFINKFKEISNNGWIKGINNQTNSVGLTFEKLLNKKSDSMFFPDYYGIEIKCTQRFSRYPITLFSSSLDGPNLYEMNNFLNKYGKNDFKFKNRKTLNSLISNKNKILFNNKFYFKLNIDKNNKKMFIEVYDLNEKLIEKQSYINFETLKTKLQIKLTNLSLVFASKKKIYENLYFRYYKIIIYKFISFDKFIELIEKNIILVEMECRISRSGTELGRQRNKNILFKIDKNDIDKLYKKIYEYNHDEIIF